MQEYLKRKNLQKIAEKIFKVLEKNHTCVLAIDGSSTSGKSTLANELSQFFDTRIIHLDDFYLPRGVKDLNTSFDGNIDLKRFKEEIIDKLFDDSLTYRAFYLAQKYRNPTMILADGLLGQMMEPASFGEYPYPEVDVSSWALTGAKGRPARTIYSVATEEKKQIQHIYDLHKKFEVIAENETSYEEFNTEDAEFILVAFGSMTRNIKAAMNVLRAQGKKVGCFRPITLSPFPYKNIKALAEKGKDMIVVEMNMGQMLKDVKYAVEGKSQVSFVNRPCGEWLSVEEIVAAVNEIIAAKEGSISGKEMESRYATSI